MTAMCASYGQTSISGIINEYAKVTYITTAKDRVTVSGNSFSPGDKIMIIQMKGASVNATNTPAYGTVTAMNGAGNYEFNRVRAVSGDTVFFPIPFCLTYNPDDSVQLIKVPVYKGNAEVAGTLTCPDWGSGGTGGIIVFEVADTLILQADIDATGKGFRGAQSLVTGFACGLNSFFQTYAGEGMKGEGIAHYVAGQFYGRGKIATGGGGASAGNSGAGGGGHFGAGGKGGNEYSGCGGSPTDLGAIGGSAISYTAERIFMGGGGGGPQRDNGSQVYPGGNGGGIIIIKAGQIQTNNHHIRADGESVVNAVADEGTSGGGAGGCIYLVCEQFDGPLSLSVTGGRGGATNNLTFPTFCHGPGGGGGGGLLMFTTFGLPSGSTAQTSGGAAGLVLNPASRCYNTSYGAAAGQVGGRLFDLPDMTQLALGLDDVIICSSDQFVTLKISGRSISSVLWSGGQDKPSITVRGPGTHTVSGVSTSGCIIRDTVHITMDTLLPNLGPDLLICPEASFVLSSDRTTGFVSWQWQDGSSDSIYHGTIPGLHYLTVETVHGCTFTDSILVTEERLPGLRDTVSCGPFTMSVPEGHHSYLWSTGEITHTIEVSTSGSYKVRISTLNGCTLYDSATWTILPVPEPFLGNDTTICFANGDSVLLYPGYYSTYRWMDSRISAYYSVSGPGTYKVSIMDSMGCAATDEITIANDPNCQNQLFVPVGFSPNGDGKNDIFRALAQSPQSINRFEMIVFDRWGKQMFQTSDIYSGWDGRSNGTPCDLGAYFWMIRYEQTDPATLKVRTYSRKGDILLVR